MKVVLWKSMPFLLIVGGLCLSLYCSKGSYSAGSEFRDEVAQLEEKLDQLETEAVSVESKKKALSDEKKNLGEIKESSVVLVTKLDEIQQRLDQIKESYSKNQWQTGGAVLGSLMSMVGVLWMFFRRALFRSATKKSA